MNKLGIYGIESDVRGSYGVSYAEDILFVTVTIRNESGDWCAEDELGNAILDKNGNQCAERLWLCQMAQN